MNFLHFIFRHFDLKMYHLLTDTVIQIWKGDVFTIVYSASSNLLLNCHCNFHWKLGTVFRDFVFVDKNSIIRIIWISLRDNFVIFVPSYGWFLPSILFFYFCLQMNKSLQQGNYQFWFLNNFLSLINCSDYDYGCFVSFFNFCFLLAFSYHF